MREIKFRGKRIGNNELVYGSLVIDTDKKNYSIIDYAVEETNTYAWHNVFPLTVGQFTGLLDKNGKEIYEGDIIKYGYSDFEEEKTIHQVKYMDGDNYPAFDLLPDLNCDSNGLSHAMAEGEIEVIGNIYETFELLPKDSNG